MFARRVQVEVVRDGRREPCPLDWLDSFSMRRFTGEAAFDDTLPVADGELEIGTQVSLDALAQALSEWLTKKKGGGKKIDVHISARPQRAVSSRSEESWR